MLEKLNTISQSGIKKLLKERLEHPEKYVDKPLIIWRSYFYDGILDSIAWQTRTEYNKGKPEGEWKWFCADPRRIKKEKLTFCIITFDENDYKIRETYGGLPMVLFVPFEDNDGEIRKSYPNAEEYIFQPDFNELESQIRRMQGVPDFLIDFLKSGKNFSDTVDTYRWYNYFNYSGRGRRQGCDYPSGWFESIRKLKMALKFSRQKKFSNLSDFNYKYSFSTRVSDDLKEEFREYLIKNNL